MRERKQSSQDDKKRSTSSSGKVTNRRSPGSGKKSFSSERSHTPGRSTEEKGRRNFKSTPATSKRSGRPERTEKQGYSDYKKPHKRPEKPAAYNSSPGAQNEFRNKANPNTRNENPTRENYSVGRKKGAYEGRGKKEERREPSYKKEGGFERRASFKRGDENVRTSRQGSFNKDDRRGERKGSFERNDEKREIGRAPYQKDDLKNTKRSSFKGDAPLERNRKDTSRRPTTNRPHPERKRFDSEPLKPYSKNRRGGSSGGDDNRKERYNESNKRNYTAPAPRKNAGEKNPEEIRLNRYIANAGICSRRDADLLIKAGEITVNGKVVTEMGFKVKPGDEIRHNNRRLKREKMVYVLLNKPKDFITTTDDPENRKTIMNLVENVGNERIYPVGRLDRNTTGLIILTNDGELADKLSHPSNNVKKLYQVDLDKPITQEDLIKIQEGVRLEDGVAEVDEVAVVSSEKTSVGLQIHSGKNRIVRRIFEHLGYDVVKLDRVMYAGLDKKDLPRGHWRLLTEKEVVRLKYML